MIPKSIKEYHTFFPLDESIKPQKSKIYLQPTDTYKVISSSTGKAYALKRVLNNSNVDLAFKIVTNYKNVSNPNVVSLKKCFLATEFQNDLCFVYDYHPGSFTLHYKYFIENLRAPEDVIWSYVCQIVCGLKAIHSAKLACRSLHMSKILICGKRLLINGIGINDVLNPSTLDIEQQQKLDFIDFGHLLLEICRLTEENLEESKFSAELIELIKFLLYSDEVDIATVVDMISSHLLDEMLSLQMDFDYFEGELTKELENGRLFRLLVKMNFCQDRPEMDGEYQPGGDKFPIKMFFDYLFNQADYVLNYGHVVENLNKLDCGSTDKILLMSRDEETLVVCTFAELKNLFQQTIEDLE